MSRNIYERIFISKHLKNFNLLTQINLEIILY